MDDKELPQFFEKRAEGETMVFRGTDVPVRDLFLALRTNEDMGSFCARTGVARDQAAEALDLAARAAPEIAEEREVIVSRLNKMRSFSADLDTRFKKTWLESYSDKLLAIMLTLLLLLTIAITVLVTTGVIHKLNKRSSAPQQPSLETRASAR